jgi:heme A synthase
MPGYAIPLFLACERIDLEVDFAALSGLEYTMLPIVLNLHLYNMVLVLTTSTVTGIWGLVLYFRDKKPEAINQPWKIALIVTALDGLLQGLLGVTLVLLGQKPGGGSLYYLHYVYGAIVLLAIPVAYTYASKNVRRTILILSISALIIAAAGARAMMTGLGIGS